MSTRFALPHQAIYTSTGAPMSGALAYFYETGTSTPKDTYSDSALTTANTNPVVADASGRFSDIFLSGSYKVVVKTSAGVQVYEADPVNSTDSADVIYTPSGTGAVATDVQAKLRQVVSVFDFMTAAQISDVIAGTEGEDVTAAIQAAIDVVEAAGGGILLFPSGVYAVSSTITIDSLNVILQGEGGTSGHVSEGGVSRITATHSAGPVVRIKKLNCSLRDLAISSNDARYTGAAGSNYGVQVEATDTASQEMKRTSLRNVRIQRQPNHGLLLIGDVVLSRCEDVDIDNISNGHAFVINGGGITSRTNKSRPGIVNLQNCRASRIDGHALVIGDEGTDVEDIPYRVQVDSFECFYCLLDNTLAIGGRQYVVYSYGENHTFTNCAFGGYILDASDANGGVYVAGRYQRFINNRYVDCNPYIMYIEDRAELTSAEIVVEGGYINNTQQSAGFYDPAIYMDSTVDNVHVVMHTPQTDVSNVISTLNNGNNSHVDFKNTLRLDQNVFGNKFQTAKAAISLDDDEAAYFSFDDITQGVMIIGGNVASAGSGMFAFRCGDGSAFCSALTTDPGTTITTSTGTLSNGTSDGTDTTFNVYADTASNRIYIKNRKGGTRAYTMTMLCASGGNYTGNTEL